MTDLVKLIQNTPAFPVPVLYQGNQETVAWGLTCLDYFASAALEGAIGEPTVATADTIYMDDVVPAGATTAADHGDAWTWVTSNPAPFSGTQSHQSNIAAGQHQHYFTGASNVLAVQAGDLLFAYVYLDPANPPSEVMLQWYDGVWDHRAYWGANSLLLGDDGTASRHFAGALPALGQWVRLEVDAASVGLAGRSVNGLAFTLFDGRATWDQSGKTSTTISTLPKTASLIAHRAYEIGVAMIEERINYVAGVPPLIPAAI